MPVICAMASPIRARAENKISPKTITMFSGAFFSLR